MTINLNRLLKSRISLMKRDFPNLSSSQIAKKFKVSISTLSRIENLDTEMPSIDQTIKILRGTGEKNIYNIIKDYYPEVERTFEKIKKDSSEMVYEKFDREDYFHSLRGSLILLLSECSWGLSEKYLEKEYGKHGLKLSQEMIESGILIKDKGNIIKYKGDSFLKDLDNWKKTNLIINSIKNANNFVEKRSNVYYFTAQSINVKKALYEIEKIMAEAQRKVEELVSDPDMQGPDYYYFALVADKLAPSDQ